MYRIYWILIVSLFVVSAANAKNKVTLMVLYDLSHSMTDHYPKMQALVPMIEKAMQSSRCEYQVSVSNINYYDEYPYNNLMPFKRSGEPGFITQDHGAQGIEWIKERLLYPFLVTANNSQADGSSGAIVGGSEQTYTSIVKSLRANQAHLIDQHVVGTLLLTDAAPGFEEYHPGVAKNKINEILGGVPYVSGTIHYPYAENMMDAHPAEVCVPDFPMGTTVPPIGSNNLTINTSAWKYRDIEALYKFADATYGYQWNICDKSYDDNLRRFLNEVLSVAGCLLIM